MTDFGHIYTFGYGVYGQLGLGTSENQLTPKKVTVMINKTIESNIFEGGNLIAQEEVLFSDICLGRNHTLAITKPKFELNSQI